MTNLTDITGVSESRADDLREEDFVTVDDVANATESELTEVSGIGGATAPDLIQSARDVIRGTVDDEVEEEETNTDGDAEPEEETEEEFPDIDSTTEEEEVTVEDLEEVNGEEPENEPDDELSVESDDGEPENVDVTPEKYDVSIELKNEEQFDYVLYALIDMRLGRLNVTYEQESISVELLNEFRPLGGAGSVTISLTSAELNALHALLTQTATAYQGESAVEAFNAVREVKNQVQDAREEYLL